MRRFLTVSHTVPPDGDWGLDDLAGAAGRVDVLCRNVQAALCLSHGLRDNVEVLLAFAANPKRPTAVKIVGADIKRLNPDERSTAARIRAALQARGEDPWWEEVEPGLWVAPFDLPAVLDDTTGTRILLDPEGPALGRSPLSSDALFLLSDHRPFDDEEYALLEGRGAARLSLGKPWYHGNHAIAVINHYLDQQT